MNPFIRCFFAITLSLSSISLVYINKVGGVARREYESLKECHKTHKETRLIEAFGGDKIEVSEDYYKGTLKGACTTLFIITILLFIKYTTYG